MPRPAVAEFISHALSLWEGLNAFTFDRCCGLLECAVVKNPQYFREREPHEGEHIENRPYRAIVIRMKNVGTIRGAKYFL